jgi:Xaa-Pro aminopeptidase
MSELVVPFAAAKLDTMLEARGVDAVLATSSHNTRYLMGGYRFFLYDRNDAIASSRYLPIVGYATGREDDSFYIGARIEDWETDVRRPWVPEIANVAWSTVEAADAAAHRLRGRGLDRATIGIEPAHVPADAMDALARALPCATFVDVTDTLDELRVVKTARELDLIRRGSTAVVDAMLGTIADLSIGLTTAQTVEYLRQHETRRGLTFAYGLVATGAAHGRAPCQRRLEAGAVLSLDSGADLAGYVADMARMAIAGEPSVRHADLLAQVEMVQQTARDTVAAGRRGGDIPEAANSCIATLPDAARITFQAHGMGLLTHEAPRLVANGSPSYPATHRDRPLEAGMVISIETHVADPEIGFVKLEDTAIVTVDGREDVAAHGRDWNVFGQARPEGWTP